MGESSLRTVVSGLKDFVPIEKMMNRDVVVLCNLGEAEIHGIKSNGMVLCASNAEHTIVEPLVPPPGCKRGERVTFAAVESSPDEVLNQKKMRKAMKRLVTSDSDPIVALYMDIPFMTSLGVVTVPSLKSCNIK